MQVPCSTLEVLASGSVKEHKNTYSKPEHKTKAEELSSTDKILLTTLNKAAALLPWWILMFWQE